MTENRDNSTKTLFDCLAKLYKQGQMLLLDADRLMGEYGWECMHNSAPAALSNSLNSPERWYARWATRFYMSTVQKEEESLDRLLFVSIHFASDHDTDVDEPVVSAGRLLYGEPMVWKTAGMTYEYWMCKYWFLSRPRPHETLEGWRQGGQSRWFENLKGNETFIVPLYDITSSDKLKQLVVEPLLAAGHQTALEVNP